MCFIVKIEVVDLTKGGEDDGYVQTNELFVNNPGNEFNLLKENSYVNKRTMLIEYLNTEIESDQRDLNNPMVERYCNGEMWTYIYDKVKRFQTALKHYESISSSEWKKCVAFAQDHPGLSSNIDDFYSFAVNFGSLSVGQSSVLNGAFDTMIPQNIKVEEFSQFCIIVNEWNAFCCYDGNNDMLSAVLSEYLMGDHDNNLSKLYDYVAWNIKCQECDQSLKLKL